jgi:outer membrane lipoprotein-sorting protein
MTRTLTLAALALLLVAPAAQAGPTRAHAKAQPNPALKARQAAINDFSARMTRLDRLMGVPSATGARSRSAEAGR